MNNKTLLRSTAILILFGLIFAQFAVLSPVQAATGLGISFDTGALTAYPNKTVTVSFTETFPDYSSLSANSHTQVDTRITLTAPAGVSLNDTVITAYSKPAPNSTARTLIGQYTISAATPGTFWASVFGNVLSRRPAQKVSSAPNTSYSYDLDIQPAANVIGKLNLQVMLVVAKNNEFNSGKWNSGSNPTAQTSIMVYRQPVLDPVTISGPYTTGQSTQVQIKVNNLGGPAYSALKISYTWDPPAPISDFEYRMQGGGWTSVTGGIIGATDGFEVGADTSLTIDLKLTFTTAGTYPITLKLTDASTSGTLSTSNPSAIVKDPNSTPAPEIFSNDLPHNPYVAGTASTFTVTAYNFINNCSTSNNSVQISFTGSASPKLVQYLGANGAWTALNQGTNGAYSLSISPNKCPWVQTITYQVTFNNSGTFSASHALLAGSTILASNTYNNIAVDGTPANLDLPDIDSVNNNADGGTGFIAGVTSGAFTLQVTNPVYGKNYTGKTLLVQYALAPADGSVLYSGGQALSGPSGTLGTLDGTAFSDVSLNPQSKTYSLAANFATARADGYTLTFTLADASNPTQALASITVIVYPDPIIPNTGFPGIYLPFIHS